MDPIFKDTEINGIYTATLSSTINGMDIQSKIEIDLIGVGNRMLKDFIKKNPTIPLNLVDNILSDSIEKDKKNCIADLYFYHNKRIEYEKRNIENK